MKFLKKILNLVALTGQRLKYGTENLNQSVVQITMQASVQLKPASSYFVTMNTAGNAALTTIGAASIFGHLVAGFNDLASATAGATVMACNVGLDTIYRIPVAAGTYARTLRGLGCDLSVASSVQGASVSTNAAHHVQLLDGDETNNYYVIVRQNPAIILGQS